MKQVSLTEGEKLCLAIGATVVEFQFLEQMTAEVLTALLKLRDEDDRHRIAAAMSFKQKVDLACDLHPTRRLQGWPIVDVPVARSALNAAEEFRNAVVHSLWFVVGEQEHRWMRSKTSLRSSKGLKVTQGRVDIASIERGQEAMTTVRDWYLGKTAELKQATETLRASREGLSQAPDVDA